MSFLLFDEKTQEVGLTPEAKNIDVIKVLREKDKTEDKVYFKNALKYIYHTYVKDHMFANLSISERKVKTSEIYLGGKDYKVFDEDGCVRDVVGLYVSLEYSQNEWTYEQLKNDIENIKKSINDIPIKKMIDFDNDVDIECTCSHCGKPFASSVNLKTKVEVDNTKERMDALKQILTLQDMKEKFSNIIIRDRKTKEHDQNNSLTLIEQGLNQYKSL